MKESLEKAIVHLDEKIWSLHSFDHKKQGLIDGELGIVLYSLIMFKKYNQTKHLDNSIYILENILDSINREQSHLLKDPSIGNGLAGFLWVVRLAIDEDILDKDQFESYIKSIEDVLLEKVPLILEMKNFDYLYGAFGIISYFASIKSEDSRFSIMLESIKQYCEIDNDGLRFYNNDNSKYTHGIVTGLAHGMSGYILILLQCYNLGIAKKNIKEIVVECLKYILMFTNSGGEQIEPYFPLKIEEENGRNVSYGQRLAWCNSDLNMLIVLLRVTHDLNLHDYSSHIQKATNMVCSRKNHQETGIQDAHLCHGSAGVSLFYQSLLKFSNDSRFKVARDFWISKTFDFIRQEKINAFEQNDLFILNGISGINLALISILDPKIGSPLDKLLLLG